MAAPAAPDIIEDTRMIAPAEAWAWVLPAFIGLLVVVVIAYVLWRLGKKHKLPFQHPPPPPDRVALEKLSGIRHLIADGKHMEFVIASSDILRDYVQARFNLRAPHLSTEEFLYEAERSESLPGDRRDSLSGFLAQCDQVKFALAHLLTPGMQELYNTAEQFISKTAAAPAPATPVQAARPKAKASAAAPKS
jgi:hypothetical protein